MQRLRTELRDCLELLLLPGLAALLPWQLCFALYKRIARMQWLYREQCEVALSQARLRGWAGDNESHWIWVRRLVTLVDHADNYLVRTRPDAWLNKHFTVEGHWPPANEAQLLCTFHWGAGMWSLRHAAAAGMKVHALVAPIDGAHFKGRSVLHWYAKARTAIVSKTLGQGTLDVSNSLRPAVRALRHNEQVLAVVDVPADQVSASQPIQLLGLQARVPRALLRLAVEQQIPVTVFLVGLRTSDGKRTLKMQQFGIHDDVDTLIRAVFGELEKAILLDSPAWHFWSEAERFFEL
mgnify:CR=1 FL=1